MLTAQIKQEVAEPSTCTPQTVKLLTQLLNPSCTPREASSIASRGQNSKKTSTQPHTRKHIIQNPRLGSKRSTTIATVGDVPVLNVAERARLATEIINTSLKSLTEAIKTLAKESEPVGEKKKLRSPTSRDSKSRKETSTPLKERCINEVANSSPLKRRTEKLSSSTKNGDVPAGVVAVAECARASFAELRRSGGKATDRTDSTSLQLETGMQVFIGKLLALKLLDIAVREIRILAQRLSMGSNSTQQSVDQKGTKQSLSDLIQLQEIPSDHRKLTLVISVQLQLLKMLVLKKRSGCLSKALEYISPSCSTSPYNLMLLPSKEPLEKEQNSAKQMDQFARTILTLASHQISDEKNDDLSMQRPSANECLQAQLIGLQALLKSRAMYSRACNLWRDIVEPAVKYVKGFLARSTESTKQKLEIARGAALHILELLSDAVFCNHESTEEELARSEMFQLLSDISREAFDLQGALHWSMQRKSILNGTGATSACECSLLCSIASLSLQVSLETGKEIDCVVLEAASKAFQSGLTGSSKDLDQLLTMTISLRKHCVKAITSIFQGRMPDSSPSDRLLEHLFGALNHCMGFLSRFTDLAPDRSTSHTCFNAARKYIKLSIDSILSLSKLAINKDSESWNLMHGLLQVCSQLAIKPEAQSLQRKLLTSTEQTLVFSTISNLYWSRFLAQKAKGALPADLIPLVKQSVDLVYNRRFEIDDEGISLIKLEKLSGLYELLHDWESSKSMLIQILENLESAGVLESAAELAGSHSWATIVEDGGEIGCLCRTLRAYNRACLSIASGGGNNSLLFFAGGVSPAEKGLVLEVQLSALFDLLRASKSDLLAPAIQQTQEALLALYRPDQFPIRRRRVLARVIRYYLRFPGLVSLDTSFVTSLDAAGSPMLDVGLERYNESSRARLESLWAIAKSEFDETIFSTAIRIWQHLDLNGKETWETVIQKIDEPLEVITELDMISDYLDFQGAGPQSVAILKICRAISSASPGLTSTLYMAKASVLGRQLSRVDLCEEGLIELQRASPGLEDDSIPAEVICRWHFACAECSLGIGDQGKCSEHLEKAKVLLENFICHKDPSSTSSGRLSLALLVSDFAYTSSIAASTNGDIRKAMYFGRTAVKLMHKAWALQERRQQALNVKTTDQSGSQLDEMTIMLAGASLSANKAIPVVTTKHSSLRSLPFWTISSYIFRQFLHLADLSFNEGLFQDTNQFTEQSRKIADAVQSEILSTRCIIAQSRLDIAGGNADDGLKKLNGLKASTLATCRDLDIQASTCKAKGYLLLKMRDEELSALEAASRGYDDNTQFAELSLRQDMVSKASKERQATRKRETQQGTKSAAGGNGKGATKPRSRRIAYSQEGSAQKTEKKLRELNTSVGRGKAALMRLHACYWARANDFDRAAVLLNNATGSLVSFPDTSIQALESASLCFSQAQQLIQDDPVYGLLRDSAISSPCVVPSEPAQFTENEDKTAPQTSPRKRRKPEIVTASHDAFRHHALFQSVIDQLSEILSPAQKGLCTAQLHRASDLLARVGMILSAVGSTRPEPTFIAYSLELSRSLAMMREATSIQIENILSLNEQPLSVVRGVSLASLTPVPQLDVRCFQAMFIDIIPRTWSVVTISMSESQEELRLCRLRRNEMPFVLSIPLGRHKSRDFEEELFGFRQGRQELQKIIDLANFSAHDVPDPTRKGAKTDWWAARAALDARLRDLLINIENIWLGGFRGIFNKSVPNPSLLLRFQQSFSNILGRHLPSRQAKGKRGKKSYISLDIQTLELFVSLGHPSAVQNFHEPVMDLLYFVVDILQFHGERNAYDEIDFDSILMETTDALKHYHEAERRGVSVEKVEHTVLILDKALHSFPWESMPCLDGSGVTRLPSLACLRKRILDGMDDSQVPRIRVDASRGAYVLNPSGDLSATEDTFSRPLSSLTSWTSNIGRAPTENEISNLLSSKSIYLYLGHGSGGQYIRARTIRKLAKCAVALLMGCSSGTMTESGELESYGTPLNYLHGGATAVVGTLWDVTDKDIDRFALNSLDAWGLLEPPSKKQAEIATGSPVKRTRGGKRQFKTNGSHDVSETAETSLDQAVARSRSACIMRYLNGAAPVVYGVPVFLSRSKGHPT